MSHLSDLQAVHQVCNDFETAWLGGVRPAIEDYLPRVATSLSESLFVSLLSSELELSIDAGEMPLQAEYDRRFPAYRALIEQTFAEVIGERIGDAASTTDTANDLTQNPSGSVSSRQPFRIGHYTALEEIDRGGTKAPQSRHGHVLPLG